MDDAGCPACASGGHHDTTDVEECLEWFGSRYPRMPDWAVNVWYMMHCILIRMKEARWEG